MGAGEVALSCTVTVGSVAALCGALAAPSGAAAAGAASCAQAKADMNAMLMALRRKTVRCVTDDMDELPKTEG